MHVGIDSFVSTVTDPSSGRQIGPEERIEHLLEEIALARRDWRLLIRDWRASPRGVLRLRAARDSRRCSRAHDTDPAGQCSHCA